jgi:hypothetical protein
MLRDLPSAHEHHPGVADQLDAHEQDREQRDDGDRAHDQPVCLQGGQGARAAIDWKGGDDRGFDTSAIGTAPGAILPRMGRPLGVQERISRGRYRRGWSRVILPRGRGGAGPWRVGWLAAAFATGDLSRRRPYGVGSGRFRQAFWRSSWPSWRSRSSTFGISASSGTRGIGSSRARAYIQAMQRWARTRGITSSIRRLWHSHSCRWR